MTASAPYEASRSPATGETDLRPIVAVRQNNRSVWLFGGLATVAALFLFATLDARRRALDSPPASSRLETIVAPEQVPELIVPEGMPQLEPAIQDSGGWRLPYAQQQPPQPPVAPLFRPQPVPRIRPQQSISGTSDTYRPTGTPSALIVSGQPQFGTPEPTPPGEAAAALARSQQGASSRIVADRLANPATTVPRGTLISAVLETALDSTRPGQARALVTRNVFGFDGTQILIPRGARLYGLYQSEVAQGQNRAQIQWTSLLRPDGVTIALDSPAADPLGRGGVKGRVNTHFIQRLGNALLRSTVDIGTAIATRRISNPSVVVALPNTAQASSVVVRDGSQITPTLTVRQGTRVSVFVQHDLDFASVEAAP